MGTRNQNSAHAKQRRSPLILAEASFDRNAPDFSSRFQDFSEKLAKRLAPMKAGEYLIAHDEEGSILKIVVLPRNYHNGVSSISGESLAA